jgi:hypothetical protein
VAAVQVSGETLAAAQQELQQASNAATAAGQVSNEATRAAAAKVRRLSRQGSLSESKADSRGVSAAESLATFAKPGNNFRRAAGLPLNKGGRVLTYRRKPKSRNKNGRRPTRKSTVRRNRKSGNS